MSNAELKPKATSSLSKKCKLFLLVFSLPDGVNNSKNKRKNWEIVFAVQDAKNVNKRKCIKEFF